MAIFCVLASGVVFALGAVAAENATHPPRLPVARVCPCLSHMHCESAAVTTSDRLKLHGWYYWPDAPNGGAILLLHGIGATRQDMVALGYVFLRQGYAVLEPDLRGHGESEGMATYGVREEADVRAWIDWLAGTPGVSRIYGFGASLGASVLLNSLKHETRLRAVVAESPYFDFRTIAQERIARMSPGSVRWLVGPFVESGMLWARWRYGVDLQDASPANGLRVTQVPVMLIHGLADGKTSPENSRRLAAIDPAASLWLVPGSGHADAWRTTPGEFESRVSAWFSSH